MWWDLALEVGVQPARTPPKRGSTSYPFPLLGFILSPVPSPCTSTPEQGLTVTPPPCGREGQRGSWGKGWHWWDGARLLQLPPRGHDWGSAGWFPAAPTLSQPLASSKRTLCSPSAFRTQRGDLVAGGGECGGGVVLASSLSFLPGQPAGLESPQAPGRRA